MPQRAVVARELAELLGVLAHPQRIRLVEELRDGERAVCELQADLGLTQSGVSQHLAVLRARRLVAERREGRHVYYRLCKPCLAVWLADGIRFLEEDPGLADRHRAAIASVRQLWGRPLRRRRTPRSVARQE